MELVTRLENLQSQLESSWPINFQKILDNFDHSGEDFYIYTFTKWKYHEHNLETGELIPYNPPRLDVNHCPLKFYPGDWALPGTILRKISPTTGICETVWALPEEHAFPLYEAGKMFEDRFISECIAKYKSGEFAKADPSKYKRLEDVVKGN